MSEVTGMFTKEACKAALEKTGVPAALGLVDYMQKILEWNEKINVTGAKNPEEFAIKHIADVWRALNVLGRPTKRVVDVGSGGGLPGIVLAIISPGTNVALVERRQKKAGVLSDLVSELNLADRVKVIPRSFEEIRSFTGDEEYWFRGFLPGPKLATYLSEFFPRADLGQLILMKGPAWPQEKLDIMDQPKVKDIWKERFADAAELEYDLPEGAGRRLLVIV